MQTGDWFLVSIALLWVGAMVTYGLKRQWAEALLAFCYGTATVVTLVLAVRGRHP